MNSVAPVHTARHRQDPWRTVPVRVARRLEEAPGVFTVDLAFHDPRLAEAFCFDPGQFNMLYVPGVGESAISIAGQTEDGLLRHTLRAVGGVTQEIQRGGQGQSLGLRGPFGVGWPLASLLRSAATTQIVIVVGGIGIAPLRALIEAIAGRREAFGTVSILVGARTASDLIYAVDQSRWRHLGIDVQLTVDRADPSWTGNVGVVTCLLDRLSVDHPAATQVLTCGPEVMMRYVAQAAVGRGIPQENVWLTLERHMNCAIGLCGHCQLGPEFICRDGPVFRLDRVQKWLNVQEL